MSEANLYGRIITNRQVEKAVGACVELWMNDYLGELERIEGYDPDTLARPLGVVTASEFAKWDGEQLPVILILSAGLGGTPLRSTSDGGYEASWTVAVCGIVSDIDEAATRNLAGAYAGAIRGAILQHRALTSPLHPAGFASFLSWRDESYGDIPFADTRTLDSCRVIFNVGVENVTTEQAGPREPSGEPAVDPGNWPGVTSVKTEAEPVLV